MLQLLSNLNGILTTTSNVKIDNIIFRLFWMVTSTILIGFSIILTAKQYVGDPINCMPGIEKSTDHYRNYLNTYCWTHSTFIMKPKFGTLPSVNQFPGPGIEKDVGQPKRVIMYYQWVCFVLFLQGVSFYFPYYVWMIWEDSYIKTLTTKFKMNEQDIIGHHQEGDRGEPKRGCQKSLDNHYNLLINYIYNTFGTHRCYAFKYFICEFFCLLNTPIQFYFLNWFFDGLFYSYGINVLQYKTLKGQQNNPMTFVFPKLTKCSFYKFGSSGDVEKIDVLCILPLNAVNEKIFIIVWFWFSFLIFLSVIVLIHRTLIIFLEYYRRRILVVRCRLACPRDVTIVSKQGNIGDWFLFCMLANNLDAIVIRNIMQDICRRKEDDSKQFDLYM
jgi:innexin